MMVIKSVSSINVSAILLSITSVYAQSIPVISSSSAPSQISSWASAVMTTLCPSTSSTGVPLAACSMRKICTDTKQTDASCSDLSFVKQICDYDSEEPRVKSLNICKDIQAGCGQGKSQTVRQTVRNDDNVNEVCITNP
jgi:hypothetical protein